MRHADLRREAAAAAVTAAKQASALLYDTAVVPGTGVRACGCVLCGAMSDAMGSNNTFKTFFSTDFFRLADPVQRVTIFDSIRQSENPVEKSRVEEALSQLCKRAQIWSSVENGRFRLTNPAV